jgi:hypothetical protein
MELLNATVTGPVTNVVTSSYQSRGAPGGPWLPTNLTLQSNFTYGSSGTSVQAWVQTSIDGGSSWVDVASFSHTTSSGRLIFNLSSATSVTSVYTATDGSLLGNTSKDGIFGNQWRVKWTSVGTYAGNTTLRIDGISNGLTAFTLGY